MTENQILVLTDEYRCIAGEIYRRTRALSNQPRGVHLKNAYVLGDSNFLCDYYLHALSIISNEKNWLHPTYLSTGTETEYRQHTLQETAVSATSIKDAPTGIALESESSFFGFINSSDLKNRHSMLSSLERIINLPSEKCSDQYIISIFLPEIPDFPGCVEALSEREMDFYISSLSEKTPEIEYYLQVMDLCRRAVRDKGLNLIVLLFQNVLAPDRTYTPSLSFDSDFHQMLQEKRIRITDEDRHLTTSLTYVRYACSQIIFTLTRGKTGNIYHADGFTVSMAGVKNAVINAFPSEFSVSSSFEAADYHPAYNRIHSLKIAKVRSKSTCSLLLAMKHYVSYQNDIIYDNRANTAFYNGKIDMIQQLEVTILQEIDRICQKHDIKYFLAGGTLLGAVRNGQPISWDDDLDIGMLRADYDKFKTVVEQELDPRFCYTCPYNGSGSHYTIDKVRITDSYFSTRFSSKNIAKDGVFVDVLVYDQTSDNALLRKLQVKKLGILYTLLLIKWYNKPRGGFHYYFSKLFLPLLRLIPFNWLHRSFDRCARRYRNLKNPKYLIDTVGKKLQDGPLPNEGLNETIYVPFAGIMAPIPADPNPYLTYAYGPDYMTMPNLTNRRCPHNFARIDMGGYVFGDMNNDYRKVDLRGELFEE